MHRTYALIRLVVALAPIALLAVWGTSYLRACIGVALAPGVPVDLTFSTPGGALSFHAASYAYHPRTGFLILTRPSLTDPTGATLAAAQLADVSGIMLPDATRSALKVHLFTARGTLLRNPDGQFDIQRFLKAPKAPPQPIPFDVSLDRAEIAVVDRTGGRTWTRTVTARNVDVAGVGSRWCAAGDFAMTDVGAGRVALARSGSGTLTMRTMAQNWQLGGVVDHLLATLPLATRRSVSGFGAANIVAFGPLEAVIAQKAAPKLLFLGSVRASGIRMPGYRPNRVAFAGRITDSGADGRFQGAGPGASVNAKGWIDWRDGKVRTSLSGAAKLASLAVLPARLKKQLPTKLSGANLMFTGWVRYGVRAGFGADGRITALRGAYGPDALDSITGAVRVGGSSVWVHVGSATYGNARVAGEVALNWKSKQVGGGVRAVGLPVSAVLNRIPGATAKIKGDAQGTLAALVLVSGTVGRPELGLRVRGSGSYATADIPRPVRILGALAVGRYRDGKLTLQRVRARTPAGAISAVGSVDFGGRRLEMRVDGRGIDVADFTSDVTGLASISGSVVGSFDQPSFIGQVEGYDLGYKGTNVALTTAQVAATRAQIAARSLDVVIGSTQIKGNLALDLPSKALSGELGAPALQVGDFLGDAYAGLLRVQTAEISGTLDEPHALFTVAGVDLLAQDLQVDGLAARAALAGHTLTLTSLVAKTASGDVEATGRYDIDANTGSIDATGKNLNLAAVLPAVQKSNRTLLAGSIAGHATLAFANNALTRVVATGSLAKVKANRTDLGEGVWSVAGDGRVLHGSIQASFGTRFLALENATVDFDSRTLDTDVVASNLTMQDVYQFAAPYMAPVADTSGNRLALLDGDLKALGHIGGKWDNPNIDLSTFEADKLSYNGVSFGKLSAVGTRQHRLWSVSALNLTDGTASATAKGTIDETGDTHLDGEFHNFDLGKLAAAFPGLPRLGGVVSSSFLAEGPSKSPRIRAALDAESVALDGRRIDFGLNLDTITVADGGIDASGAVTYQGFHGQLAAHVPFKYPFQVPDNAPVQAKLTLDERPLADIAPYLTALDPKRVDGAINGSLVLSGIRDHLHVSGGLNVRAATIGLRAVDPASKPEAPKYVALSTELKDLVLSVGIQDSALTADVAVKSSRMGSLDGQFTAKLNPLDEVLNQHTVSDVDAWLASPISGRVALNGVAVREQNRLANSSFAMNGSLTASGTLASPAIGGNIALQDLSTTIPGLTAQTSSGANALINPAFNVDFSLTNPGHISTSLASIYLSGKGHLGGTLNQLVAGANLTVVRGTLRLPGGAVTLAPGGTVRPAYVVDSTGSTDVHVPVDVFGDGHVTAVRNGDVAERYDVHLDVHGDLLVPEQVAFTATSDPPDLSQDQILALLGRTDLLTALGSSTGYSQGERQLQTAALGYAVPSLFDPITSRLAANLGLDYLSVEYNALDQTSVLASKSIGHGFSFQFRRQVSLPTPGFPLSYDYRLVYRLPTRSALVRRFSFFFGRDELVPWKLGLQYSQRL